MDITYYGTVSAANAEASPPPVFGKQRVLSERSPMVCFCHFQAAPTFRREPAPDMPNLTLNSVERGDPEFLFHASTAVHSVATEIINHAVLFSPGVGGLAVGKPQRRLWVRHRTPVAVVWAPQTTVLGLFFSHVLNNGVVLAG